eukprot:TRINITY_DN36508_c0_g1_i1.p1 TRINITY_DN36508_c0_g1~~TRINITY_DN36508_c0_g1_i1.p1  ORF type:complete len:303 (-),score=69.11 TRINITY_DN36508_c0_g1_i1:225-1133(-)
MERCKSSSGFKLVLGEGKILRALEISLRGMHLGETKQVAVSAEEGFGEQGVDGVVPPNCELVYELTLVSIMGRKHVVTHVDITKYEDQLKEWRKSKETEYGNDPEFRKKQVAKYTDLEGYTNHLDGVMAKKMAQHAGARQFHEEIVAPGGMDQDRVANDTIRKVRIYMCPYAVCKYNQKTTNGEDGRGFVFVRSPNSMAELFFHGSSDQIGRRLERSLMVQYLDMEDGMNALVQEIPGIQQIVPIVSQCIQEYDPQLHVVVVFLSGCGYLTCLKVNMVPDWGIACELSSDYNDKERIQLNVD